MRGASAWWLNRAGKFGVVESFSWKQEVKAGMDVLAIKGYYTQTE